MSRLTLSLLLALFVTAGLALPASAASVKNLTISSSDDVSGAAAFFPAGTEEVYAIIEYVDAANEPIAVAVDGPGLPNLISSASKRYNGDGTDSILLSGIDFYRNLVDILNDEAGEAKANVQKAQTQSAVYGYLEGAQKSANQSQLAVDLLLSLVQTEALGSEQVNQMKEIRSATAQILTLAQQAFALPSDDLAGKQALAAEMEGPAQTMVANGAALVQQAQSLTSMPLPITGLEHEGYTVVAEVGGNPSMDVSFGVGGDQEVGAVRTTPRPTANTGSSGRTTDDTVPSATQTAQRAASDNASSGGSSESGSNESSESASAAAENAGFASVKSGITSLTATPRPGSSAELDQEASLSAGSETESDAQEQPSRPVLSGESFADTTSNQEAALPTWTPPSFTGADGAEESADDSDEVDVGSGTTGTGPNIFVLGAGALVLVGLALWMRRSM
jgi:hypothetical protein